jgi:hypothetical protein
VQIIADRDAASAAQAKADLAYATATEARKETTETKERLGEVMSGALVVPGTARAFSEPTGNAQSWPAEILNRIERLKSAPVNWDVDTVGEIFGSHAPESNGRKLEAMIETDEGDSLVISLRVSTVPSAAPLEGEVTFLLDPTYPHRIITKRVRNSWAILKISAAEWFTVAAIADEGRTVLTYSLRQLPGAPEWFKVGDG